MKKIESVVVYCGSSNKVEDTYKQAAKDLGLALAHNNIDLVFGAGNIGLMGIISNTMKEAGSKVTGVTTIDIEKSEIENPNLSEKIVVQDLRERKKRMDELCDAVIGLPGGLGTIDEVAEMIVLKQIHQHNKPIVLFNVNGFWDNFVKLYEHVVSEKFAREEHLKLFKVANTIEEVLKFLCEESKETFCDNWRL